MDDLNTSGEIASGEGSTAAASPAPQDGNAGSDHSPAPAKGAPAPAAQDRQGWIPPDVHSRILDRYHERLDALGWANGLDRAEVEAALALHRQQRERGSRSAEPQPDARDERGELYYTPKQAAKWAAWEAERIVSDRMREFEQRFAPIETTLQQSQQEAALQSQIDAALRWPGFSDHMDEITAAIAERNQDRRRDPRLPKLTLHEAYIEIVVPKLSSTAKKQVVEDINKNTEITRDAINPSRRASSGRKPDEEKTTAELLREEMAARKSA